MPRFLHEKLQPRSDRTSLENSTLQCRRHRHPGDRASHYSSGTRPELSVYPLCFPYCLCWCTSILEVLLNSQSSLEQHKFPNSTFTLGQYLANPCLTFNFPDGIPTQRRKIFTFLSNLSFRCN